MLEIYLDHASTSPMHPQVVEAMFPYMTEEFGNPSSVHSFGRRAREALRSASRMMAEGLKCNPEDLVFTSGGTEADNLAIVGTTLAREEHGKHLVTSEIEHLAVLRSFKRLEQLGFEVTCIGVDRQGRVDPRTLRRH